MNCHRVFEVCVISSVDMILKYCPKREKLGREAPQFFSFATVIETHINISNNTNFKNTMIIHNFSISESRIKINFYNFTKYERKSTFEDFKTTGENQLFVI